MKATTLASNQAKSEIILMTLSKIPRGKVSTYGDIASYSGFPGLARYVASILKNLPENSTIPWHRVINSQGRSSFPKNSTKYLQQIYLLKNEGIQFSVSEQVSKAFFW
tara:strand:+ start:90 stop:413 length:324 start_codon:yes stop_codon:yes gene_type:complete